MADLDQPTGVRRDYGEFYLWVIGRSTMDIGIWNDPDEGSTMVESLRGDGLVVNREMMFRTKHDRTVPDYCPPSASPWMASPTSSR